MRRTDKALEQHMRLAALRAAEDPAKILKALRVIQAAIETERITMAEVKKAVQP